MRALPAMRNVIGFTAMCALLFGLSGVYFFSGSLRRYCVLPTGEQLIACTCWGVYGPFLCLHLSAMCTALQPCKAPVRCLLLHRLPAPLLRPAHWCALALGKCLALCVPETACLRRVSSCGHLHAAVWPVGILQLSAIGLHPAISSDHTERISVPALRLFWLTSGSPAALQQKELACRPRAKRLGRQQPRQQLRHAHIPQRGTPDSQCHFQGLHLPCRPGAAVHCAPGQS